MPFASSTRPAPLAGRPPWATDDPDDTFDNEPPRPTRRIRQPAQPDPNDSRDSAYGAYDHYFEEAEEDNRHSGVGGIGMGFLNADLDDSSDESDYGTAPAGSIPSTPISSRHNSSQRAQPAPKPSQQSLRSVQPISASRSPKPAGTDVPPAPRDRPPPPPSSPPNLRDRAQPARPNAPPGLGPEDNSRDPYLNSTPKSMSDHREDAKKPPNIAVPRPSLDRTRGPTLPSDPRPPPYPPNRDPSSQPPSEPWSPPRPNRTMSPEGRMPGPNSAPMRPPEPATARSPPPMLSDPRPGPNSAPPRMPDPSIRLPSPRIAPPQPAFMIPPHESQAPLTPITPVFAQPAANSQSPSNIPQLKFSDDAIMRGNSEETLLSRSTEKGNDFWRRFSMVAHEANEKPAAKSAWLKKTESGRLRMSIWVWLVSILLLSLIGGGIGAAWYFTRNSSSHIAPTALGGSAGETQSVTGSNFPTATTSHKGKATSTATGAKATATTNNKGRREWGFEVHERKIRRLKRLR